MHNEGEALEKIEDYQDEVRILPLFRGVWADELQEGDLLPVGGSMLGTALKPQLHLDFSSFEDELIDFESYTQQEFQKNKEIIEEGLRKNNIDIDPKTFFYCALVSSRVLKTLQPERIFGKSENSTKETREEIYVKNDKKPKLSDLREKSACPEIAGLGQHLLQRLEVESAYVSGVIELENSLPENHSFIVINDRKDSSLIFDIARATQNSKGELRHTIMRTAEPFTYDLLKDENDKMIKAENVTTRGEAEYGVMQIDPADIMTRNLERMKARSGK